MTPIFVYRPAMRIALLLAIAAVLAGCSSTHGTPPAAATIRVVAAENVWGSLATQLGDGRVQVTSIVHNPATDPHDYEPTTRDARELAGAQVVIENGAGYDPWVAKLLSASPSSTRIVLNVGKLVGVGAGGNPHRWYAPADVQRAIDAITAGYTRLEPQRKLQFAAANRRLVTRGLQAYNREIETIRERYAGVKVGASESIFAPLAQALGLKLVTPSSFLNAISEGSDPTAEDLTAIGRQISTRTIKVWVFNSQNSTPDVQRLTAAARAHHIPVVAITETLSPESGTFESWQVAQLLRLAKALGG
jgi:zinc/manganese transport system substrate-binding protein